MKYISLILIVSLLILGSCKKDSDLRPEDMGYCYFPYEPGDYLIYDVDSTYYDDFFDTTYHLSFQIKEYYESYFYDSQGRLSIRIERWYKMTDTTDWYLRDVWYSCKTPAFAERTEENIRITRLIFPVQNHSEWDGNAFNIYDSEYFEYDDKDEPYSVGSFNFDSTVTVIQDISSNLIEDIYKSEIYARNVGLVYKKYRDVTKNFVSGSIESGTDYTWTLVEYGQE